MSQESHRTVDEQLREMNEALLVSLVRQHELTEQAQKAEAALRESERNTRAARDELELRVRDRTAELAETVEALRHEAEVRRQAEAERQELLAKLVNAQEEERRRIARDLHDSLGQYITAMNLGLTAVMEQSGSGQATASRLAELLKLAREMGKEAHRLATELRPRALDDIGLAAAIHQTLTAWGERTKIFVEFAAPGLLGSTFPTQVSTTVFRVIQEALNNVAKHAQATQVSIVLERKIDEVVLVVEDDGRGFDFDENLARNRKIGGLGIAGMKERAALARGALEIESTPGEGTTVYLRIPLAT